MVTCLALLRCERERWILVCYEDGISDSASSPLSLILFNLESPGAFSTDLLPPITYLSAWASELISDSHHIAWSPNMLFVCIFREIHHSPIPLSSRSTHPFFTKHTQLIHTSFIPLRGTRCTHPLFTHMLNSISRVSLYSTILFLHGSFGRMHFIFCCLYLKFQSGFSNWVWLFSIIS